jgi:hypothetical protein
MRRIVWVALLITLAFVFLIILPIPIHAQEQAVTIVGRTVRRVDAGRYLYWSFEVPGYACDGRNLGSAEAAGGTGNDFRRLILDA